jgi:hypothetical protein
MRIFTLALPLLFPVCLAAQTPPLARATGDLNGNAASDTAILVSETAQQDEFATLIIFHDGNTVVPALQVDSLVDTHAPGTRVGLRIGPAGTLAIHNMNPADAGDRWHRIMTVTFTDGEYLLTGYSYRWSTSLNGGDAGYCKVDFLTGKGAALASSKSPPEYFQTETAAFSLKKWRGTPPVGCPPE